MATMACKDCHLKEQQRRPLAQCKTCHGAMAVLHTVKAHAAAGCAACHVPHTWAPPPREPCLACHSDKAQHNPGPPCAQCHGFRSGAAGKAPSGSAPPAITFPTDPGSPGPVTFQHASHLARGAKCPDCHPRIFRMQKGAAKLSMADMTEGKACGTCHNGRKAFGVTDGEQCATCHKM